MDYDRMVVEELGVKPTKHYGMRGGVLYTSPFGAVLPNGSTFNKSVFDPDSHLVQLLYYIRDIPMTRNEILEGLFQFDLPNKRRWDSVNGLWIYCNPKGWRTPWFAGIRKAGFVTVDDANRWHLSGLGARVLRYHGMY